MNDIDFELIAHHPAVEEAVDVLCAKTQNTDRGFFRAEMAYFLGKIASNMRATIVTKDRGEIPVNIYALALATSGYGKGHSVNIVEEGFLKGFKQRFMSETLPTIAEQNLWSIANDRAVRNGSDQQQEFDAVHSEWTKAGAYPFTFDSGTPAAVKQLRHKLLLSNCGSINLQIDEIGSNLVGSTDVLNLFLELYDQGLVKQKITKNTAENTRAEELDGKTPTNMLLFGTSSKLFDGGQTEDQFYSFLETGYARRCIFGHGQHRAAEEKKDPAEVYRALIQPENNAVIERWAEHYATLAAPENFGFRMVVEDDVAIQLIAYKLWCEDRAAEMGDHMEIPKAELSHRYFKALKLAGAYAFVDLSEEITLQHLHSAVKLVEESGQAFQAILSREKNYVKLARFISGVDQAVTHADLHEALPYYKSGNAARNEMMMLATAWGYRQHIVIKKTFQDGIEFFEGETLKETDLNELSVSYSTNWAYHYEAELAPFDKLNVLATAATEDGEPIHWTNHVFRNGHRSDENVVPGFNLIVIDCDGEVSLDTCHELLREWKFMTYTTKRHQTEGHGDRFRLVIPISYWLELSQDEYRDFMNSIMDWLPFKSDEGANQRARKWESNPRGEVHFNVEGKVLDILDFIPRTSRNEALKQQNKKLESLDNLERWFAQRIAEGNRNNQMVKFAFALKDGGLSLAEATEQVRSFNQKLSNKLPETEIENTVLRSLARRYIEEGLHDRA